MLKTDAKMSKLDIGLPMFHDESWKPIYLGAKMSKVKVTTHNNSADVGSLYSCECWLLVVDLFLQQAVHKSTINPTSGVTATVR